MANSEATRRRAGYNTDAGSVVVVIRSSWLMLAVCFSSCANVPVVVDNAVFVRDGNSDITVRAVAGALAVADIDDVAAAVPAARACLTAWHLSLQHDVVITIHGSVHSFIQNTGQIVPTLRAWSSWRDVHLLTTDTWRAQDDDDIKRRLTHELCHLGLQHRIGRARGLPRLLSEGVCSVVADQGADRLDVDAAAAALDQGRVIDFDDDSVFAYAVAHHVVAGLARCHGDAAVLALVDAVAARDTTTTTHLREFLPVAPRALIGACR